MHLVLLKVQAGDMIAAVPGFKLAFPVWLFIHAIFLTRPLAPTPPPRFREYAVVGDYHTIVMDLVPGKELYWFMEDFREQRPSEKLPHDTVRTISFNLLKAVGELHEKGVSHRDIKDANAIVGDDLSVKVRVTLSCSAT